MFNQTTNRSRAKLPSTISLIPIKVDLRLINIPVIVFFLIHLIEVDCSANENLRYKLIEQDEVS